MDQFKVDSKLVEINQKIELEEKLLQGAMVMMEALRDKSAREQCELNVIESKRRLEFLELEAAKLSNLRLDIISSRLDLDRLERADITGELASDSANSSRRSELPIQSQEIRSNVNLSSANIASSVETLGYRKRNASEGAARSRLGTGRSGSLLGSLVTSLKNLAGSRASLGSPLDHINARTVIGLKGESITSLNSHSDDAVPVTGLDALKFSTALTSEKIKYRMEHVKEKIDIETKFLAGTDNMLDAIRASGESKTIAELESQSSDSKRKLSILQKSERKYSGLYVSTAIEEECEEIIQTRARRTGRLVLTLLGAKNVPGRRSAEEPFFLTIRIDGKVKGNTKSTLENFGSELFDIQVDKAHEIELCIYGNQSKIMTSFAWFNIYELEEDMKLKAAGQGTDSPPQPTNDEFWLDMEPGGQVLVKATFVAVIRALPTADKVFRRNAVQKIHPRNDHKFVAQASYQIMQCAVCSEMLSGQTYQCQTCQFACHPRCYNDVITNCITAYDIAKSKDSGIPTNSGKLLKYNIPHRLDSVISLAPSWCMHCATMLPVGRRIIKCTDCGKGCHKQCADMIPNFCGLKADMAKMLVGAYEEHEKKMLVKEMDEEEKKRIELTEESNAGRSVGDSGSARESNVDLSVTKVPEEFKVVKPLEVKAAPLIQAALLPVIAGSQRGFFASVDRQLNELHLGSVDKHINELHLASAPNTSLDDFRFLAVLGRGAFGKVMLATELATQQLYAIKALKKEFIIQNDDVKSTKLEKKIFQTASIAHHPFLVNLHSCFHTDTRIYFVMEYVPGGDLMSHMMQQKRFSTAMVRFYTSQVLLALEYFHQNNIIYRDLKLENILMTPSGYIKVADYGICKDNMAYGSVTRTFCGTPDYMAPEILNHQRYGRAVDWWSLGILVFVMNVGRYPYHGASEADILDAILTDNVQWPTGVNKDLKDFVQALLNKNPVRRLGCGKLDAEEVKKHHFFTGVSFDDVMRMTNPAPWKPKITSPTDISNFDPEFTREKPILTPLTSALTALEQSEFQDFQYTSDWGRAMKCAV